MVPVDSRRVSRAPRYSGTRFESGPFSPTRLSRFIAPLSSGLRLTTRLVTLLSRALNPCSTRRCNRFGLFRFRSPLLSESNFFLFLQVLRWFTSLGLLVPDYGFIGPYYGFTVVGFPIRTSPDRSLLAALRGFSQLATSFIAYFRQGIHHAL